MKVGLLAPLTILPFLYHSNELFKDACEAVAANETFCPGHTSGLDGLRSNDKVSRGLKVIVIVSLPQPKIFQLKIYLPKSWTMTVLSGL